MRATGCLVTALTVFQYTAFASISSAPAFIWGTSPFIHSTEADDGSVRTVSEAIPSSLVLGGILQSVVTGQVEKAASAYLSQAQDSRPDTTLIFVSSELAAQDKTLSQLSTQLQPLQDALNSAPSALILPHVTYKGPVNVGAAVLGAVEAAGEDAPSPTQLGACGDIESSRPASVEALSAVLSGEGLRKVVVVCPGEQTLAAETALFSGMQGALAAGASSSSYAVFYLAQPSAAVLASSRRRALLEELAGANKAPKYYCDATCETQVRLIEGVILLFNVLLAIAVGSWMLHSLGTPTRFEAPREPNASRDM